MSPSASPILMPFDPDAGSFPPALEALFARPAATVPALLLVAGPAARKSGWAERAAIAVAAAWAERRGGIVLADLGVDAPALHGALGEENTEGLADVFEFGLSLSRVARAVPGRAFRFVSAGPYAPDVESLIAHPRWQRIVARFAEDQATLLVFVHAGAPGLDLLARRMGKAIILARAAEAEAAAGPLAAACSELLRLCPAGEEEVAAAAPAAVEEPAQRPGRPSRPGAPFGADPFAADPVSGEAELMEPGFVKRTQPKRRGVSPVLLLLLVLTLGAGGWFAAQRYLEARDPAPPPPAPAATASAADQEPPEPVVSPVPYSVAIEAHADYSIAQARVATLRDTEPGIGFYLAPVVVDGVIYYRVLAGPSADSTSASALMRTLVDRGHKTDIADWDVRPTIWAYKLGDFSTPGEATMRAEELLRQGVPTYTVEIPYTSGPSRYRLYAGAYENPAQAEVMAQLLRSAGESAPLVRRTGRPAA